MCSNIGTPKIINFPFETNGKLMVLGVPIFKHFWVFVFHKTDFIYDEWILFQRKHIWLDDLTF